jgi:hypothetical protein
MWTKHIHGQPKLARQLEQLAQGQTIRLRINGVSGVWEKMRNRPDGSPTPGLRPVGEVAEFWRNLFEKRRGELVELALDAENAEEHGVQRRTPEERVAAIRALLEMSKLGWRSEKPYGPRDELYER